MFREDNLSNLNMKKEITLSKMKKGNAGIVKRLITEDVKNLQKLLAMGILPGRIIHVIQTYPVYILQIDNTQAAMDKELAEKIIINDQ